MNRPDKTTDIQSLLRCPKCNLEMLLFRTEVESDIRDLYTFHHTRLTSSFPQTAPK